MPKSKVHPLLDHLRRMPATRGQTLREYVAEGVQGLSIDEELPAIAGPVTDRMLAVEAVAGHIRAIRAAGFRVARLVPLSEEAGPDETPDLPGGQGEDGTVGDTDDVGA